MVRIHETEHSFDCILIDGGVPHALELEYGLIALIDSASLLATRLKATHLSEQPFQTLTGVPYDACQDGGAHLRQLLEEDPEPMDERIHQVLVWLDRLERERRWEEVSLDRALELACLSRSRFLHLFSAHVGSPWRTYLVWRRALVAITLASEGVTLTQAAHQAGYSDSAHLSRQFLSLFGISPGTLLKNSHFVQSK